MWSVVYLGPSDYLAVDQESAYTSKEMREFVEGFGIRLDKATIERPDRIGVVEKYHVPVRLAYDRIYADTNRYKSDQECLQVVVFAINRKAGPESVWSVMLVLEARSGQAWTVLAPSQLKQAELIDRVMDKIIREQAKRKVVFGLKHSKEPKSVEHFAELWYLSVLSLFWSTNRKIEDGKVDLNLSLLIEKPSSYGWNRGESCLALHAWSRPTND